jgi:hypothetical protein
MQLEAVNAVPFLEAVQPPLRPLPISHVFSQMGSYILRFRNDSMSFNDQALLSFLQFKKKTEPYPASTCITIKHSKARLWPGKSFIIREDEMHDDSAVKNIQASTQRKIKTLQLVEP